MCTRFCKCYDIMNVNVMHSDVMTHLTNIYATDSTVSVKTFRFGILYTCEKYLTSPAHSPRVLLYLTFLSSALYQLSKQKKSIQLFNYLSETGVVYAMWRQPGI